MDTKGPYRPGVTQTVTVAAASAATTNAVTDAVYKVRLISDTDCHVVFAVTPVATTGDMFLAADSEEYFAIQNGEKVAVIQNAAGGILYVTEVT